MYDNIVQVISNLLDPPAEKTSKTKQFINVPHDEILYAYKYWLEYLKLLVKEPFIVEIIQGQQDEGVDLLIRFLTSDFKLGIQVKSYNDIKDEKFREKIMAQIAYSKKHNVSKLLIILCADLENQSQSNKVRNLMSQLSQMSDDYVMAIQPQKVLPVYLCHKNKKHPLVYLSPNKSIIELIKGLSESLSNETQTAEITITFHYKIDATEESHPLKFNIKFKSFDNDILENPMDKLTKLQKLGEKVMFTKDEVEEITIKFPDGRIEKIKPDSLIATPENKIIGPLKIFTADNELILENVMFYEESRDTQRVIFKTGQELMPWFFQWTAVNNATLTTDINFEFNNAQFKDLIKFFKMMRSMKKSGMIIFDYTSRSEKVNMPISSDLVPEITEDMIEIAENMAFIEGKLGIKIPVSMDDNVYNRNLIREIALFLKTGRIEKSSRSFTITGKKSDIQKLIDDVKNNGKIQSFDIHVPNMKVQLAGQNVSIGLINVKMKNVVIDGNVNEILQKIEKLKDGESIDCPIKSDGSIKDIYELVDDKHDSPTIDQ